MRVQTTNTQRPATETEISPEEAQVYADRLPNGEAVAALISAGIGVFVLGLLTTLAEASTDIANMLNWNKGVGPLSGKTIVPVAIWLISWVALTMTWKGKNVNFGRATVATFTLILLGLLLTFPLFFDLFKP